MWLFSKLILALLEINSCMSTRAIPARDSSNYITGFAGGLGHEKLVVAQQKVWSSRYANIWRP